MNQYNERLIAQFRANGGTIEGQSERSPIVLLTHTGAKSGQRRTTPVVCSFDGDTAVVVASMGGAPTSPAWYHNMVANPQVTVEVGAETFEATAVEVHGEVRQRLFDAHAALIPVFHEYQAKTSRVIPVLRLVRN
jgi:deazaflavin-dependent oxidoreductase (nitroreductase family)